MVSRINFLPFRFILVVQRRAAGNYPERSFNFPLTKVRLFVMPRTIAIGDIHGCSDLLRSVLQAIDPKPGNTIICLGDFVDKGIDSEGVIDLFIDLIQKCRLVHDEFRQPNSTAPLRPAGLSNPSSRHVFKHFPNSKTNIRRDGLSWRGVCD